MSQHRPPGRLLDALLRFVAPLLVLSGATAAVWLLGAPEKRQKKQAAPPTAVAVDVVRAKRSTGQLNLTTSGVAIPYREVILAARVDGEVLEKSDALSPGRVVSQNDLLIRIDPTDYDLQVEQWTSEVAKVGHELSRLAIDRDNTQQLVDVGSNVVAVRKRLIGRLEKLRNVSAASLSEQDIAELARLTAEQQLTVQQNTLNTYATEELALNTSLELAKLKLRQARTNQQRTEIRAPFTGVVIANHVEKNGYIEAGDPVATIEDTSQIEVRASLRREDLAFLQGDTWELPQVPVTVRYDHAGDVYCWSGVLSRQDGLGLDERTRTMPVRIRIAEPTAGQPDCDTQTTAQRPQLTLLRGMFVEVELHCQPDRPLVEVPESVIRPGKTLWLLQDGRLHIEPVRIAHISHGIALVDSHDVAGLLQQQIISTPVAHAREGLAVRLKSAGKRGSAAGDRPPGGRGRKEPSPGESSQQPPRNGTGNRKAQQDGPRPDGPRRDGPRQDGQRQRPGKGRSTQTPDDQAPTLADSIGKGGQS